MSLVRNVILALLLITSLCNITYTAQATPILVIENPSSALMEHYFNVTVTSNGSAIFNATVVFNDQWYTTDFNGQVRILAPSVVTNTSFPLSATKNGYLNGTSSILVLCSAPPSQDQLSITAPSSVVEGHSFDVTVKVGSQPIVNVTVVFNGNTLFTGGDGRVIFTAPQVSSDRYFTITASKTWYTSDQADIFVEDESQGPLPQLLITAPSSVDEGNDFLVTVTADGSPIYNVSVFFNNHEYLTDVTGKITLRAPSVDQNTVYVLQAIKDGYQNATKQITVIDTAQPSQPSLEISAPSSVVEGNEFLVTVTSDGRVIANATVTFYSHSYTTNAYGKVTITAPSVTQNTVYPITAALVGYFSATHSLTVIYRQSGQPDPGDGTIEGSVYGWVTTLEGQGIEGAEVCLILSNSNNVIINKCTFTNLTGFYNLSIPPGTYPIKASKNGFITSEVRFVVIQQGAQQRENFTLHNQNFSVPENSLIDVAVQKIVEDGRIAGSVNLQSDEQQQLFTEVTTYNTPVNIAVQTVTNSQLIFTINGSAGINGTVIAVRIGPGSLQSMKNITILYDNMSILWVNFDEIFDGQEDNDSSAQWTSVLAIDGDGNEILYVLFKIRHFSTHTIAISSLQQVIDVVGGPIVILVYVLIAVIAAIVFVGIGEIHKRF